MSHIRIAKCLVVFGTTFMLLAIPVNAPFTCAHLTQINARGTLTLNSLDERSFDLAIDKSFTSTVPGSISMGSYDYVTFHGFAIMSRRHGVVTVKLEGLLTVKGVNFWVEFNIENPTDLNILSPADIPGLPDIPRQPLGERFSASGQLDVTISETALPPPEITWVLMKGKVAKYGESNASGDLVAHAKLSATDNWTQVHGASVLQPPPTEIVPKNFSLSFYVVTLDNVTRTELDYDGYSLCIEGSWDVYDRTMTVTVVDHTEMTTVMTIRPLVEGVSGNLTVALTSKPSPILWQTKGNFTLQIEASEKISGDVVFYHVKLASPFERGIPLTDFDKDREVSILDITQIARVFEAKLGSPKYNFDMGINSDFVINILDVTTAAKEFGQEY